MCLCDKGCARSALSSVDSLVPSASVRRTLHHACVVPLHDNVVAACGVQVCCRFRPLNKIEMNQGSRCSVLIPEGQSTSVSLKVTRLVACIWRS